MEGISEVRGRGLLLGIVTIKPIAVSLRDALQERGVLVNAATEDVIRIAPPLIVTEKQISKFVKVFESVLKEVLRD